jgi:hypothetical protein
MNFLIQTRRNGMIKRLFTTTLLIFFMVGVLATFCASAEIPRMTKEELRAMLGHPDLVIIDVRLGRDWAESDSKIKGAIREDSEAVETWARKYPKNKTFLLY